MASLVAALPVAWFLVVVTLLARRGPAARRAEPVAARSLADRPAPLARRTARSPHRRVVVGVAVLGALGLVASPIVTVVGAAAAVVVVAARRRAVPRRHQAAVVVGFPEVIDLFVVAAVGGLPVPAALGAVASRAPGPIGASLRAAHQRQVLGEPVAMALDSVAVELGPPLRPLVRALDASDRYGSPLVPALQRLATEARIARRRRAEEQARRLPVSMLFPLVCCSLPAFALLTVVPLLVSALRSLQLS